MSERGFKFSAQQALRVLLLGGMGIAFAVSASAVAASGRAEAPPASPGYVCWNSCAGGQQWCNDPDCPCNEVKMSCQPTQ